MSFVITGSVAYDYLMSYPGRFRDHILADQLENITLSFLVDTMTRQRGGVATNIAYTYKLLNGKPTLFSTVGQDFGDYRRWLEEIGIDTGHLVEIGNKFTASFFCNTDVEGRQISSFYSGAMLHASEYTLAGQGLQNAQLVLIGAGDPVAMLNQAAECKALGLPFALDPSWQVARFSGEEMTTHFQGAAYLFCNDYESAIIQSKTGWSLEELQQKVAILVVTHSERGSMIYTDYGRGPVYEIPSAKLDLVVNPTGAGDAYRGGFFAARRVGLPLDVCGRVGALSAVYSLEHAGPIDHHFTIDEFRVRYEANFGPESRLAWLYN